MRVKTINKFDISIIMVFSYFVYTFCIIPICNDFYLWDEG